MGRSGLAERPQRIRTPGTFAESCEALDTVHAIHQRHGDQHLAGRALISKSLYTEYQGNANDAEKLIRRGLELIDQKREPSLYQIAVHNLLLQVVEQGRALAGMLVLRRASEEGVAPLALLRSMIQFLIKAESDPSLSAEDFLVP